MRALSKLLVASVLVCACERKVFLYADALNITGDLGDN